MAEIEGLSNYIAVAPLAEADAFGVLLPSGGGWLCTPAGHTVESDNYRLLLHMVRELEEFPVLKVDSGVIEEPRPLCTYLLYSSEVDFVRERQTFGADDMSHLPG